MITLNMDNHKIRIGVDVEDDILDPLTDDFDDDEGFE